MDGVHGGEGSRRIEWSCGGDEGVVSGDARRGTFAFGRREKGKEERTKERAEWEGGAEEGEGRPREKGTERADS